TYFFGDKMLPDPFVHSFVVSAENNEVSFQRQGIGHLLVKYFSVGSHIDHFIVSPLSLQCRQATKDWFHYQDHAGTASKSIVIDLSLFAGGIIPQIMNAHFCTTFVLRPL